MPLPTTFLINLDRNASRRETSETMINGLGLSFRRFPAVDGLTLPADVCNQSLGTLGRKLSRGEVGCFLSHLRCAELFLETDHAYGLVLEDDFMVRPDGKAQLDQLWASLDQIEDWDVINLGRDARRYRTLVQPADWRDTDTNLYRAHYFPITTTGLLWTRAGAAAFLNQTRQITMPVDIFLREWTLRTGRGLAFSPSPLSARPVKSEIDMMQPTQKKRGSDRRFGYPILRVKFQLRSHLLALRSQRAWL